MVEALMNSAPALAASRQGVDLESGTTGKKCARLQFHLNSKSEYHPRRQEERIGYVAMKSIDEVVLLFHCILEEGTLRRFPSLKIAMS